MENRKIVFDGPFAEVCVQFINYKQSLGYVYGNRNRYAVKSLDDFFKSYDLKSIYLTKEMVQDYVKKRNNESGAAEFKI